MSARTGRATARAPLDKPGALNAPLFRTIVEQLEAGGRHVVLELGPASTPMLELLGRFRCRVEIADLADGGIERLNAAAALEEGANAALEATAEALLPPPDREPFALVLCWDLPNYLQPAALSALMTAVAARTEVRGLAHALIVYSERSMPQHPGRWVPDEELRLVDRRDPTAQVPAPRYSPEDLGRNMGGFAIDRGRLLANGMQEMLFRLPV